jgi:hypothetical protein
VWTLADRVVALAYEQIVAATCRGCGGDLHETTDPDNASGWTAEPVICERCAARDRAARDRRQASQPADHDGVLWVITPRKEVGADGNH